MKSITKIVKSKYIIKGIFDYLTITKSFLIVKYNKKIQSILELESKKKETKVFLLLDKIIKPIANCEDYLPIIQKLVNKVRINNNSLLDNNIRASDLFVHYFNRNNPFIPQINNINDNEEILKSINNFKIGFNDIFIKNFFNHQNEFEFNKLVEFCNKYGHKIKEITFMDNNIIDLNEKKVYLFIMKYIIKNSNIEKIEDRYYNILGESLFFKIFKLDYSEDIFEKLFSIEIKKEKKQKDIMNIIKGIKYYSLYFDCNNNKINAKNNKYLNDVILLNSKEIKELKVSQIDEENSLTFIKLIKNLNNLESLSIENVSVYPFLFDEISKEIKENSFTKLEMSLNHFEEGINIINKNLISLKELTLKIISKKNNKIQLFKVLSNLANLNKLRIIADFQIINDIDINYFSFKKMYYLEIPLYIKKIKFDFNYFFEKAPNLEILKFYGIQFDKNNELRNNNDIKLNENFLQKLKKIKFYNCYKNSSFFIIKLLRLLSNTRIKDNITEIKIENCDFDEKIGMNDLFKEFSYFRNITNLQINNINFSQVQNFFYDKMNNFKYLQKFYFKGLDNAQNMMHTLSFLSHLEDKCKYLIDLGLSCKNLNSDDINLILRKFRDFKYLSRVNIFDNYSTKDYYYNRSKNYLGLIDFGEIKDYYLIDLRNLNFRKAFKYINTTSIFYPKIYINDFYHQSKYRCFTNKKEKYYSYQNIFLKNCKTKIMYYSHLDNLFIVAEIMD